MATYMYGNVRYSKYIMEFHRCKFYLGIIQYPVYIQEMSRQLRMYRA